nr:retrotransposon protein, putative, Ty1-copia subclass [Tanacetum cinerariifolium]
MRALLIQRGCEAAQEVLPADMEAQTKAELNKKAHTSYERFVDNLLYGREALTLEDVMDTLNSKEIKERSKAKGDDGEGLYERGRTDREIHVSQRESQDRRLEAQALLDWIMDSGCLYHMTPRLDILFDFLECDGGSVQLGDNRECELNASVEEKDILAQVWHKRPRHISKTGLQVLEKQGLFGKKSLDLWGSSQVESLGGERHFLSIVDDYSKRLCIESGIARHLTVVGTPQQNGVAEQATCTAVYLIYRSSSRVIEKKTPMEIWPGHPSDYGMLRIFDCVAYPHDKQGKLEPRAVKYVLLGYPEGVKGYRLYRLDDESPKIITSKNMVFNESIMYKDTLKDSGAGDMSVEELQVEVELQRLNNHTLDEDQTDHEDGDDEAAWDQATDQPPNLTDYHSKWKAVMKEEMDSLKKNKIWELVNHSAGQKLVSCKWLFKIKDGIEGVQKPRYKARLVARGFTQREDYELEQLDVKMAFLHGNLEEVIYMRQPSGYEQGNKVSLLKKSLYSLKQSPRQWYKRFDEYMLSNGFKRSSYDGCVYYMSYALGEYSYLLLYVDDMMIACKSKAEIGSIKSLLKKEFDIKELGEAKKILGMEIVRDRSRKILRVSQSRYVSKILNNFRIDNGKLVKMPVGGHFKMSLKDCPVRACNVEKKSKVPYANAIRSLMYLMGTANVCLVYGKNHGNHVDVTGFVDSDYDKDPDKGRSITGYAFLVHGCVVSWKAMLQHVVALSTIEAEYMALTKAVNEAI